MKDAPDQQGGGGAPNEDETEFNEFWRDHFKKIENRVHRRWPAMDAADITAEVIEILWLRWNLITGDRCAYAFSVAKNIVRDLHRAQMRYPMTTVELQELVAPAEAPDRVVRLTEALEALPPHLRKALVWSAHGWSHSDIAQEMGCASSTCRDICMTHAIASTANWVPAAAEHGRPRRSRVLIRTLLATRS